MLLYYGKNWRIPPPSEQEDEYKHIGLYGTHLNSCDCCPWPTLWHLVTRRCCSWIWWQTSMMGSLQLVAFSTLQPLSLRTDNNVILITHQYLQGSTLKIADPATKILSFHIAVIQWSPVCAITGSLTDRDVETDGAVAVSLTALVAALHPLDEPWGLFWPSSEGSRQASKGGLLHSHAQLPMRAGVFRQQSSQRTVTRLFASIPTEDAVDVQGFTSRLPGRLVASSRRAGFGLAAGAVCLPVSGLGGGVRRAHGTSGRCRQWPVMDNVAHGLLKISKSTRSGLR